MYIKTVKPTQGEGRNGKSCLTEKGYLSSQMAGCELFWSAKCHIVDIRDAFFFFLKSRVALNVFREPDMKMAAFTLKGLTSAQVFGCAEKGASVHQDEKAAVKKTERLCCA